MGKIREITRTFFSTNGHPEIVIEEEKEGRNSRKRKVQGG